MDKQVTSDHPPQSLLHRLVTVECKLLQETDRELRVTLNVTMSF